MSKNRYPSEHKEERKKAIEERGEQCEITGAIADCMRNVRIEAHHTVARVFGGPHLSSNYQLLESHFHAFLHRWTKSDHPHLIQKRAQLQESITNNPNNSLAISRAKEVDSIIIPEYIEKLMDLPTDLRDKLIASTLESTFTTIRDLTIEVAQLREQLHREL